MVFRLEMMNSLAFPVQHSSVDGLADANVYVGIFNITYG